MATTSSDPALTLTLKLASQVAAPKADTNLSAPLNLAKVLNLFLNKHTCELSERQCNAMRRMCRHNPNGFDLRDLPCINRIMTLACDRLEDERFIAPLCGVLQLCGRPFQYQKSNDLFRSADVICDTLVIIGSILGGPHGVAPVQLAAAQALQAFLLQRPGHPKDNAGAGGGERGTSSPGRASSTSLPEASFSQQIAERGGLALLVVDALRAELNRLETASGATEDGQAHSLAARALRKLTSAHYG